MTIEELQKKVISFRDKRDWKQFHNPKDLSISLTLEATELLEHFQWKSLQEVEEYVKTHKDKISDELADVFYWVLLIGHDLNIDLAKSLAKKMKENEKKYPIKKAKGSHKKYTEIE